MEFWLWPIRVVPFRSVLARKGQKGDGHKVLEL